MVWDVDMSELEAIGIGERARFTPATAMYTASPVRIA